MTRLDHLQEFLHENPHLRFLFPIFGVSSQLCLCLQQHCLRIQHKMSCLLSLIISLPAWLGFTFLARCNKRLSLPLQGLCVMSIIPLGVYLTFQVSALTQCMSHCAFVSDLDVSCRASFLRA